MTWDAPEGPLSGTNGFRLMPAEPLATRPAIGTARSAAAGDGLVLDYRWEHPQDGPQEGVLLVGSAEEDGTVRAAWIDSWHQHPGPMVLAGTAVGAQHVTLAASYAGEWGWQIELSVTDAVEVVMRNVVPASALELPEAEGMSAGPYDVMVLRLSRAT